MDTTLLAHVKWYVENDAHTILDLGFATSPATLGLLAAAVATAAVWRLAARRWPTPELAILQPLGRLAPWVPRLIAIHLGVSLLSLAVADAYLSPALSLTELRGGWVLALVQGALGVWLITGVQLRPAAVLVVALGPLGLALAGPVPVLESVDLLGLAGFIALLPPGADRHGARPITRDQLVVPLLVLRSGVGTALIVLAFSEKLLVPDLARALLAERPWLDPLQQLGLTADPDAFLRVASATEVLIGLLVLSGAAPQLAVLVAAVPFNLTLVFFDRFELIGHLPIYGALLALLVYGSHPDLAAATSRSVPWRRHRGRSGRADWTSVVAGHQRGRTTAP